MRSEQERVSGLLSAQANAVTLFGEIGRRGIIAPGRREQEASDGIRDLANEMFGTTRHWHKRIVRSGPNTLAPYRENPPDRTIGDDDIAFADFGPIFAEYEADLGRTYVIGDDPVKHQLAADLPVIFEVGRTYFAEHPDVTGAELYAEMGRLAEQSGWALGSPHSGHLVGEFPHEKIDGDAAGSYIAPENTTVMRGTDTAGQPCHWILEVHLVDQARGFGGFYEQLLDLG